MFAKGFVSTRL